MLCENLRFVHFTRQYSVAQDSRFVHHALCSIRGCTWNQWCPRRLVQTWFCHGRRLGARLAAFLVSFYPHLDLLTFAWRFPHGWSPSSSLVQHIARCFFHHPNHVDRPFHRHLSSLHRDLCMIHRDFWPKVSMAGAPLGLIPTLELAIRHRLRINDDALLDGRCRRGRE